MANKVASSTFFLSGSASHLLLEFSDCPTSGINVDLVGAFLARSIESSQSHRTRAVCQWAKEEIDKIKKKTDEVDR